MAPQIGPTTVPVAAAARAKSAAQGPTASALAVDDDIGMSDVDIDEDAVDVASAAPAFDVARTSLSISLGTSSDCVPFSSLPLDELSEEALLIALKAHKIRHSRGPRNGDRYRSLAVAHRCNSHCLSIRFLVSSSVPVHDLSDDSSVAQWYQHLLEQPPSVSFPQKPSQELEDTIVRDWLAATTDEKYRAVVCACCSEHVLESESTLRTLVRSQLEVLTNPELPEHLFPPGYDRDSVFTAMLDNDGIVSTTPECSVRLCSSCWAKLRLQPQFHRSARRLTPAVGYCDDYGG